MCGVCVCEGNSGAVGEEPGLIPCRDWRDWLLSVCSGGGKCDIPEAVGEVTMMFGLSCGSSRSFGNGKSPVRKKTCYHHAVSRLHGG